MQDAACLYCGHSFQFAPAFTTLSNKEQSLPDDGPNTAVLQCPKCQQWLIVRREKREANDVRPAIAMKG